MAHRIELEARLDELLFRDEGGTFTLPARCWIAPTGDNRKSAHVSLTAPALGGMTEVALFRLQPPTLAGTSRFQALVEVLTAGVRHLVERRGRFIRMKPDVVVVVDPAVQAALGGYHEEILLAALEDVGARVVLFRDGPTERPAWSWRPTA